MTSPSRYLWFAPNAGQWSAFRLEHRLADALARAGRAVTMVHCDGLYSSFCPVMASERLTVDSSRGERGRVCSDCRFTARMTEKRATYATVRVDDRVTASMREQADRVVAAATTANWADLVIDEVPVGRYAGYLTMLHHKLPDVTASAAAWQEYLADLWSSVVTMAVTPRLLEEFDPTHVVVYNPLYPANRVFAELAVRSGRQLVGVAAGGYIPARYDTAGVYQHISASQTIVDSSAIRTGLETPCSPAEVRAVGRHVRELIGGSDPWVYSSAPSRDTPELIRARLGVRPDAPVAVVLVSSPDETRSTLLVDAEYFRDVAEGYSTIPEFLAAAVAGARSIPEVDVVFRLHPRLLPNKREQVVSPDLARISALLEDLPPNAVVNSASDGLSLYDLMQVASTAVNQSSSAGLEFLALGLPVVQFDPVRLGAYPPSFTTTVERGNPEGLSAAIRAAVAEGWSLENSRRAFRWYATTLLRALLHLEAVPDQATDVDGREAAAVPASAPGQATPRPLPAVARAVVPASWREKGTRVMSRRSRAATIPPPDEADTWTTEWIAEWIARLDATVGSDPVWEPLIVRRGEGDLEDETRALREELDAVLRLLRVRSTPGLGRLGAALEAGLGEQVL